MELKFKPIKNQTFDIGRTIDIIKCDCSFCDFMNCPKNNYAPIMERVLPTFQDFWDTWGQSIVSINNKAIWETRFCDNFKLKLTYDQICNIMECIKFPLRTTFNCRFLSNDNFYKCIIIETITKNDKTRIRGSIQIDNCQIGNVSLSQQQLRLAKKIKDFLWEIKHQAAEDLKKERHGHE